MKPFIHKAILILILVGSWTAQVAASTSYTLITEPDQGLTPIYTLINSAKHTIDMTMYELSDTTAEQDLVNQAAAGVTVRVILDINLEQSNNQAAYNFLNANGVQCHWADPKYAATHQKTITIDGAYSNAQTAIMTLNLTPQYYSTSRDFAIIENDPNDISAIETTFQADFTSTAITPPVGDDLVWSPTNSQTTMVNLINSAQHTLLVENEEMSDTAIVNALVSAAERGVNVQINMQAGTTYKSEWDEIMSAGGDVSTYAATAPLYIHAKVIIADYGYSTGSFFQGSENFSSASLTENRELGLIINNLPVMASLATTLTKDFNGGVPETGSPANFTLLPNVSALSVTSGSPASATITATPFNSFKTAIALSTFGLPSGVTATFSPTSISGGSGTSTVTFTASASAVAGTYLIGILGAGGSIKNSTAIDLTVGSGGAPGFTLSASPASLSISQGSAGNSTITSTATGGFDSTVSLSASGLPTGVTASFNPNGISGGSGSSTLTLTASASATVGTSTVTITGTGSGVTETTSVSLTVTSGATPSFTLSAAPSAVTVSQGNTGASTITSTAVDGFNSTVTLSATGLPSGVSASFNPTSIAGGSGASTLTFTVGGTAAPGTSTVTVTGTGGGLMATTSIALTITASAGGQLITDGGFESATKSGLTAPGWSATTTLSNHNIIIYHGSYPYAGKNYASLGAADNANDTLTQTITIPAGSTSTPLTFELSIYTKESNGNGKAYDFLYVEIHNTSGTLLATPLTFSNLNDNSDGNKEGTYFQPQTVDLSAYAGQTIELVFHGTNDYEDATTFLIDNVSVTAN